MPYKDPEAQRQYMRDYQRKWIAARREAFFADKACVDCGSTDRLELDHRDPSMKKTSVIWSWAEVRRQEEIAKCDVRCYDCHRERHYALLRSHGIGRYQSGCRCAICKSAKSAALKRETRRRAA